MVPEPAPNGASGGALYAAMLAFFEADQWPYAPVAGQPVVSLNFQGENGRWTCYAQAREEHQQFVFYSVCPVVAPEPRRASLAEFITRANYGLIIGNFELDYADGEIRYKTSVDVEGAELSPALVRGCVYANVLMMDTYLPGLMAVIYSNQSPQEALRQIEQ